MSKHTFLFVAFAVAFTSVSFGQQPWSWKAHVYASDGFTVELPYDPAPHQDVKIPDATVYSISFGAASEGGISLRVVHQQRDCDATLGELKTGALSGKQPGIDNSSVKSLSVSGRPGLEYQYQAGPDRVVLDRYICGENLFYIISVGWRKGRPRPAAATRIVDSFRLLKTETRSSNLDYEHGQAAKRPDSGSVTGPIYKNEYFGFAYTIPDGFDVGTLEPAAMEFIDGQYSFLLLVAGDRAHSPSTGKLSTVIKVTAWSAQGLWGAGWREKTGGDYLRKLRAVQPPPPLTKLDPVGTVREQQIAGRTFYEADARSSSNAPGGQGVQANFVTVERGYIVQFIFEASTQEQLDKVVRSMDSLAF